MKLKNPSFNPNLIKDAPYPLLALKMQAEELIEKGQDILDLTVGDPQKNTFSKVREGTLSWLENHQVCNYPNAHGEKSLREAISEWAFREYGEPFDADSEIISCNGTKEAIFSVPLVFDFEGGGELFFSSLSYPVYKSSVFLRGIGYRELKVDEKNQFFPDLASISPKIWEKCRLFWINSPHNPTTGIASRDYFKTLLKISEKYGFLVASDECYNDLYYGEKPVSMLEFPQSDRWVVFRSLSKRSHMTGYRSGAILSKNSEFMRLFKKARVPMGVGTPDFVQKGAIEAWRDDLHVEKYRKQYKNDRDLLKPLLEKLGFQIFGAEAGFYFWLCHPTFSKSDELSQIFLKNGLLGVPGTSFGKSGEGFLRIVYCLKKEEILRLVGKLKEFKL